MSSSRHNNRPPQTLTSLLLSLLALSSTTLATNDPLLPQQPIFLPPIAPSAPSAPKAELHLRHIFHHGTRLHPSLHRKTNIRPDAVVMTHMEDSPESEVLRPYSVGTQDTGITRLKDRSPARMEALQDAGIERGQPLDLPSTAWTTDKIRGPNVTDKETVVAFAKMAANAYVIEPWKGDWEDVGGGFNYTEDFGWQADGLRGHIFADTTNKTVVIGLKGTSPALFDGEETTTGDKINDNLFFSCCCGQGGSSRWLQVCDCKTSTYTCNSTCLVKNLRNKDRYYGAAKEIYHNVTALYPNADIWLTGHSLGGAVSSLLGLTYGIPVLTFGAPGDAMPALRLGLPTPPEYHIGSYYNRTFTGGYHFGHTADSIYTGTCNGWTSTCSIFGYAMESLCHTGYECRYDTVKEKGWRNNMLNHRMAVTLHQVIEAYDEVAKCEPVTECWDCYNWKYYESNGTTTTTKSSAASSTFTQTRTETCKTPGWWGCRDATTTTAPSSTVSIPVTTTSTLTSTTCLTPGFFGCKEYSSTTITTVIETSKPSTTTCVTKGLLGGCKDWTEEPDESPWKGPKKTAPPERSL